ncbi:hypothetical protein BLNAU_24158 [Blattamonas nauphoetae]|uniref:Uncharacterized protein n=1 Tax=Blattamonas nauphoetae TaxID=2049346 RepID=A0ABQ9WN80_9EUKA|nr:hypothetical protein BLNAU_24158 [Blattamonas nauphoetae]
MRKEPTFSPIQRLGQSKRDHFNEKKEESSLEKWTPIPVILVSPKYWFFATDMSPKPNCVVFASDLELLKHQAAEHGNVTPSNFVNSRDVKINHNAIHINLYLLQMNRTRGYRGRRREEDPVTSQPFHNMFLDPSQLDPRSFPSLSDQAQSEFANNYHNVWKAGMINEEHFPSLPGGTPVRSNPIQLD